MNGSELLDKLSLVDTSYVEAAWAPLHHSSRKLCRRWAATAACIALLAAGSIWIGSAVLPSLLPALPPHTGNNDNHITESDLEGVDGPQPIWNCYYNEIEAMADAASQYIPGYFRETLSQAELEAVQPGMQLDWLEYAGEAGFDGQGVLVEVFLWVTTTKSDTTVTVTLSPEGSTPCCLLPEDSVPSCCNGVEYRIGRWENGDSQVTLFAESQIHDIWFTFSTTVAAAQEEQARSDFEDILECFTYYDASCPDLSAITAQEIPQWKDTELTQTEALKDPDFGEYFLPSVPPGFTVESIHRYQDQNSNALWGLWAQGYAELRWEVRQMTTEDMRCLVDISQDETYDLSLYPIPRADSVPEHWRDIVDHPVFPVEDLRPDVVAARTYTVYDVGDSDGVRTAFAVCYDDIVVEVQSKGVDPQWIYEQLLTLRS